MSETINDLVEGLKKSGIKSAHSTGECNVCENKDTKKGTGKIQCPICEDEKNLNGFPCHACGGNKHIICPKCGGFKKEF